MMFYRAPLCKTCGVKSGMGSCSKCEATREEVKLVEQEMREMLKALPVKARKGEQSAKF